jgi:hypothetical protein
MQPPMTRRVRFVLFALPLAGLLFSAGIVGRGPSLEPSVDPAAFASSSVEAWASGAWLAILAGMVLELPGLFALYLVLANGQRERLAFWGVVLSIVGVALVVPLIGFMALAAPTVGELYQAGQIDVMAVAVRMTSTGPALLLAIISGVTYCAGSICLALALRGMLPQALVVAYAAQAPLLTFAALFSVTAELIGAVLLLMCGAWIVWRTSQSPARTAKLPMSSGSVRTKG